MYRMKLKGLQVWGGGQSDNTMDKVLALHMTGTGLDPSLDPGDRTSLPNPSSSQTNLKTKKSIGLSST